MLFDSFDHARRVRKWQDSTRMERFWNLQRLKFVNHNDAKMVDVWNINKLTEERIKIEVDKLQTKVME